MEYKTVLAWLVVPLVTTILGGYILIDAMAKIPPPEAFRNISEVGTPVDPLNLIILVIICISVSFLVYLVIHPLEGSGE